VSRTTTSRLNWLPSAANGISLVASSTAWTYGSWVELTSSAPSNLYAAYLAVLPNDGATLTDVSVQIQIGVGSAGNEVVVATVRVRFFSSEWGPASTIPLGLVYDRIASGARVALRVLHGASADTDPYRVALGYHSALGGITNVTSYEQTATPLGSATVSVAGTTAWANGAWSTLVAASTISYPVFILGIVAADLTINAEIDLGTGSTPTVVATVPWWFNSPGTGFVKLPNPIRVAAGTAISMRQRANTSDAFFGTIWYVRDAGASDYLWEDDFEGPATLADDGYAGVGSVTKVAGAGTGASQAAQGSTDLAEFQRIVAPAGRTGTYIAEHRTSRNNVFAYGARRPGFCRSIATTRAA
jgi:hypothetical protein